jgi:predicted amidohydrolase
MRLLLCALRCEKGDIAGNLAAHVGLLEQAAAERCDMVVFPEFSLTGYVGRSGSVALSSDPVNWLAKETARTGVAAVFGIAEQGEGDAVHITQVYARDGHVIGSYRKRHLGEDEEAYTPGTESAVFSFGDVTFGIAICAEGRVEFPFADAAAAGASLVLFCAAPGLYGRRESEKHWREGFAWWQKEGLGDACERARTFGLWIAMSSQAGATVDEDFPGIAALIAPDGSIVDRLPDWREGTLVVDVPV